MQYMKYIHIFIIFVTFTCHSGARSNDTFPIVINTWPFTNATAKAWEVVNTKGKSALDALVAGCSQCEYEQCDHTVGYGGSPNENGETTLDALIIDGKDQNVGAVAGIRRIKNAIQVARKVLEHTSHSILVGDEATQFAVSMGFKEENLTTSFSYELWKEWKEKNCQPNFWNNVTPNPKRYCGPYRNILVKKALSKPVISCQKENKNTAYGHDTIGMIVIDKNGELFAGTSTNGAKFKIPGRIGDGPIPGAGAYADADVGGAAATGDGDITLRYVPSFHAVIKMKEGMNPMEAAEFAMRTIRPKYPSYSGAIVTVNMNGEFGAACLGIPSFKFSVASKKYGGVTVKEVLCINSTVTKKITGC